jgi:uncharacterized membrane protein YesL
MAGFFGLFNYDKEGPGISKNGPKKKTFIVFFETFFRNFWKFIPINIVYALISVPVFTNGIASVGLTNVARNTARDKHSFGLSDFFETIKKNLKQALFAGIINTFVYAIIIFAGWFYFTSKGTFATIGLGITFAMLFIFTVMNFFLWTLIITFDFSLKQAYKNSFKFVFINMKYNLLCMLVNILIIAINVGILFLVQGYWLIAIVIELIIFLLTYPAFNALLIQYCTFPSIKKYIIDPYYAEHPDLDIEKRRSLGLVVETKPKKTENTENSEETDEEDSDVIFED